ncbi:hypothetical protein B0H17DRAFT_1139442 [Mycena rosella]|uniref:Uncharacterized protein n=1 Tax=Mycena rosella TaxID=1033263 RepID=A0AAD7G8R7_MYCRO|nr:hypothetical protein B0H17DRAFT_1139442 [Mycena rosella]
MAWGMHGFNRGGGSKERKRGGDRKGRAGIWRECTTQAWTWTKSKGCSQGRRGYWRQCGKTRAGREGNEERRERERKGEQNGKDACGGTSAWRDREETIAGSGGASGNGWEAVWRYAANARCTQYARRKEKSDKNGPLARISGTPATPRTYAPHSRDPALKHECDERAGRT